MAPPPETQSPNLLCFCLLLASTATLSTPYSSLCSSPPPAADEHTDVDDALSLLRSFQISTGYFSGGGGGLFSPSSSDDLYSVRSFYLFPHGVSRTSDRNLLHLTATVTLRGPGGGADHGSFRRHHGYSSVQSVSFVLDGYYSSPSLELCMVGTGTELADDGSLKHYTGVALRLRVPSPAKLTDPFVTGVLDVAGFKATIHLAAYSEGDNYKYGERVAACSPPAPLRADFSCALLRQQLMSSYRLEHGGGPPPRTSQLLRRMHVNQMQCTGDGGVRAYLAFSNATGDSESRYSYRHQRQSHRLLDDEAAVVAEGHWDSTRSTLCLRACRVVLSRPHTPAVQQQCGIRMSFWFPAVWTIRDRSVAAGTIWSTGSGGSTDNGLIAGVMSAWSIEIDSFGSSYRSNLSDVKYSYNHTAMFMAKKQYVKIKTQQEEGRSTFMAAAGNLTYSDLKLSFIAYYPGGNGDAFPLAIGEAMIYGDRLTADESLSRHAAATTTDDLVNVSYDIDYHAPIENGSDSYSTKKRRISAEGVYDSTRGIMSMVGCWKRDGSSATDCEVLVAVQLPSRDGTTRGEGVIRSMRKKDDLLFFEGIGFYLFGMYSSEMAAEVSRMDLESVLLVVSTTLWCVFAAVQIVRAKRDPEAAAATSTTMLAILASGHLASLVLTSDALFASRRSGFSVFSSTGSFGWASMELNAVMLRVPTLVAFVLHLRLLQLAWFRRRSADRDSKAAAAAMAERRVLQICVPLYVLGGALAGILHAVHAGADAENIPVVVGGGGGETAAAALREGMVAYLGLVLDGFLLPQIILNVAAASSGSAPSTSIPTSISPWFYLGGAALRATPHGYDAIRARGYAQRSVRPSYVYASHRGDLFGVAWNVVIPCAVAALVFMQQGRRQRLRRPERRRYEMVSPGL